MNILSSLLVALGLSMDNFAVTIATGCCYRKKIPTSYVVKVSCLFSFSHFVMFSLGWLLGTEAGKYLRTLDHWLAFGILLFIGCKMIKEAFSKEEEEKCVLHSFKTLCVLAFATSVDALLVGMGLAFSAFSFWLTIGALVASVFVTSWTGFYLGAWLGRKFGKVVEAFGGVILIGIGVKLLLEGFGIC